MKIFNREKTQEVKDPDLRLGYCVPDKRFVAHHDAVAAVAEQWHYETVKEYPNGGKDVRKVIDADGVEAQEAYDEYEDVLVYLPYTERELDEREIAELKDNLRRSDYQAIKFAEGELTESEYEPFRAERRAWRKRINDLQEKTYGEETDA